MPTTADLLDAWDTLRERTMPDRAAALVSLADPALAAPDVETMPLGRRDWRLLELRVALFGETVNGISTCPSCAQSVETAFSLTDLMQSLEAGSSNRSGSVEEGSWRIRYRAPNAGDASALAASGDATARALVVRCVIEAHEDGSIAGRDRVESALPDTVVAAIASGIASLDPAADVLLEVTCPSCGHTWHPPLDVAAFLWTELSGWARHTLRDVACLARAYGWREPDILAMSTQRRADYLEMLAT